MRLRRIARRQRLRGMLAVAVVITSVFAAIALVAELVATAVP